LSITFKGAKYYRTAEVCDLAGVGKSTLMRWLKDGVITKPLLRDRRGWRLFTEDDVEVIQHEVNRTDSEYAIPDQRRQRKW
jgi:excisionase family DNA binding protein